MNVKTLATASALASTLIFAQAGVAFAQTAPVTPVAGTMKAMRAMRANFRGSVTAINGSTMTVYRAGTTVSVDGSSAKLIRRFGAASSVSEFSVGDMVAVQGTWTDSSKTAVTAKIIRDVSIQKRHDVFSGKVTSVSDTGFEVQTMKRATQTVTVNANTKYYGRTKKAAMTLSNIQVGDRVTVRGLWDRTLKTITEVDYVRDASFPSKTTVKMTDQNNQDNQK